ncbi:hypothetical protein [Nocardioides sp. cx-173]|uniref:hypothetical protein n=1 Tax=Nocardioides sp. cx-173 TaxID=2898796 RepID=UPI001E41C585|nr:hypothetical protein [Nocardioides sp. cx-173]MCD4527452.1 hypothetical protein [Nocardioides sp. cx-173]UGB40408.1 hypothetical protein LQ940_13580 [Nocardioides sp. cx-173]
MPKKVKTQTETAAEVAVSKKQAKGRARTNRPKDADKSKAGKASAAARKAKREKGEPIARPCSARRTNGEPCKNSAIRGGTVCARHGGSAPQVRAAANRRLVEMVLPAMKELHIILTKPDTADADKLKAISMVLNRSGYSERQQIDIGLREPTPWDDLETSAFTTILRGRENVIDESPTPQLSDAQREALASGGGDEEDEEALAAFLAHRERTKAREAETRLTNDGHDVVTGEVVDGPPPDSDLFGYPKTRAQRLAESGQPTEHDPDGHRSDEEWFEDYERRVREAVEDRD